MENNIEKILIHEQTILSRLDELGEQITKDYENKDLLLIGVSC